MKNKITGQQINVYYTDNKKVKDLRKKNYEELKSWNRN